MNSVTSWLIAAAVVGSVIVGGLVVMNHRMPSPETAASPSPARPSVIPIPHVPGSQTAAEPDSIAPDKDERAARAEAHVQLVEEQMKEVHKTLLKEMRNPWEHIYYQPVIEKGRIVGLKFSAPEEREFLRQYGLDLGDVITGINGHDLDGGIGLAQAMAALSQSEQLALRIRRGNKTFTVQVTTGQTQ
jgi:type II secretory pathway component PulC